MKTYADTGFVVSLYKMETTTSKAAALMGKLKPPVLMSPLGELELANAFQLSVFRGEMDAATAVLKAELFKADVAAGVFVIAQVPSSVLHPLALELARRHSAKLGARSLDLMHVAAALILEAEVFLSFDERQCKAA